ncbi:MAG: undecaprenyl-diphosphatase UppP [Deferrisomatales bacterium]
MEQLHSVLLGLLQGLTEFLPVSSSGHLVLAQSLIPGFHQPGVVFDVLLHAGTLLAVLVYFREDVAALLACLGPRGDTVHRRLLGLLVVATVPTGVIGVAFKDSLETLFHAPRAAAGALLVTGALLWASEALARPRDPLERFGASRAVTVGVVQGLAIVPGISRSGSTIATAALLGVRGEDAARFSFLLSIPAILGAVVLESPHLRGLDGAQAASYLPGVAAAFVAGLWAIRFLMGAIRKRRFRWFALYCWALGAGYLLLAG